MCFSIWNYHISIVAHSGSIGAFTLKKNSYVSDNQPISGMPLGMYVSKISTYTLCKSLVMIKWHRIMKNTNKCMNKKCCVYSVN